MADLDAAASNKCEMLRPTRGPRGLNETRDAFEAPDRNGGCRGKAERDPVQDLFTCAASVPSAQVAAGGVEIIVGNDFDQIDLVEMRKDPGSELGPPAEPNISRPSAAAARATAASTPSPATRAAG
jgi:hypothetical protein